MRAAPISRAVREESHASLAHHARTFHLAGRLLPADVRDDAALLYAFCRMVDDAADESASVAEARAELDRIEAEWQGSMARRPLIAAFREMATRRDVSSAAVTELLRGVRSDLGPVGMADDANLLRYCYRVASTVGLMMCSVLRVESEAARAHAVDLGIAMQLTNICRDVAEDAAAGRVYLPEARLVAAGSCSQALLDGPASRESVSRVVRELLEMADGYYRSADRGMRYIPWRARGGIMVASRVYRAIGVRLRRRGCDPLRGRTVVPRWEKAAWGARALWMGMASSLRGRRVEIAHDAPLHRHLRGLPGVRA